jgi:tubulin-specific chaperone D
MELLSDTEDDSAWHGACLALGELARRGLLLPNRLPSLMPALVKAFRYDKRRGSYGVGAHVRDAASYVAWAFARAYAPAVMAEHVHALAPALLQQVCSDREVNCRRAAAAAFQVCVCIVVWWLSRNPCLADQPKLLLQECVGRQGNFPHGIGIVQLCDYHALGPRSNVYLEIAPSLAAFPAYTHPIIDFFVDTKLPHWDPLVRQLAAQALGKLCLYSVEFSATVLLRDALELSKSADAGIRHGGLLGLASMLRSLLADERGAELAQPCFADVLSVQRIVHTKRFRGVGAELTRTAAMKLVEALCLARQDARCNAQIADLIDAHVEEWIPAVDSCVRYEVLRICGVLVTRSLCSLWLLG